MKQAGFLFLKSQLFGVLVDNTVNYGNLNGLVLKCLGTEYE